MHRCFHRSSRSLASQSTLPSAVTRLAMGSTLAVRHYWQFQARQLFPLQPPALWLKWLELPPLMLTTLPMLPTWLPPPMTTMMQSAIHPAPCPTALSAVGLLSGQRLAAPHAGTNICHLADIHER